MTTRQFVAVRFRAGDRRTYTYHYDGEALEPGDRVKVPDRSGDGWNAVEVAAVSFAEPHFATKAIIGKVEPERPAQADAFSDYVENTRSGLAGPELSAFGDGWEA